MGEFSDYFEEEKKIINLEEWTIMDVPLWRLVRLKFRRKYLKFVSKTVRPNISIWEQLYNTFISFKALGKLLLRGRKVDNVFFPHPRLYKIDGLFLDRLSDPIIDHSKCKSSYIIFERHQNGLHGKPRLHEGSVIYLDFIDNMVCILKNFFLPFVILRYKNEVNNLYRLLDKKFDLSENSYKYLFYNEISGFLLSYFFTKPFLQILRPKRVFVAPRETFRHVIVICKKKDITTYELQHGVTVGESSLYSGRYCSLIDPDYFLTFGQANIGTQFAMPLERVINIGFAFKLVIKNMHLPLLGKDVILVISDPHITLKLLKVIVEISKVYSKYIFHVRCHPQERISIEGLKLIESFKNIIVVDNKQESFCTLAKYQTIVGENSSVLYEAMSFNKKVGRLNFGGLRVVQNEKLYGGYIINCVKDFDVFMYSTYDDRNDVKEVYSEFKSEIVDNLK